MTDFETVVVGRNGVDLGPQIATKQEMDTYLAIASRLMAGRGAVNFEASAKVLFRQARALWEQRCRESWRFDEEVV